MQTTSTVCSSSVVVCVYPVYESQSLNFGPKASPLSKAML